MRDVDNSLRCFATPELRARFPLCQNFAEALQRPEVAELAGETCGFQVEGSYLRMEYIQDIDGAWLEPHHDVPQKLFSMVIYLCTGPDAADWGTDIYDAEQKWVGRSSSEFNSGDDLHPRREHLARLRKAQDHRHPPAAGDQLCASQLAGQGSGLLPRSARQPLE